MCAIYVTPAAAVEWSGVEELVLEGLLRGEPVRRQRLQQPPAQRERAVREPRHAAARGHRGGVFILVSTNTLVREAPTVQARRRREEGAGGAGPGAGGRRRGKI